MLRRLILRWLFPGCNFEMLELVGDRRWHDSIRHNLQALQKADKALAKRIDAVDEAIWGKEDAP